MCHSIPMNLFSELRLYIIIFVLFVFHLSKQRKFTVSNAADKLPQIIQ